MHMPTKKYLRKKANKLCLMGQIVIELNSGILTEPLNLRARNTHIITLILFYCTFYFFNYY